MTNLISSNNILIIKNIIRNEDVCPFNEGDLVSYKDDIFLVKICKDGYYCLFTHTTISFKKIVPDNWNKYTKIT